MKRFLGEWWGKRRAVAPTPAPVAPVVPARKKTVSSGYKKGDVIGGKYEVQGTLGKGGCGVVYLVHARETDEERALKTFREELVADAAARNAFRNEALLWVNLGPHPYILAARYVSELEGRLFVEMDFVARDQEGRVTLGDHLRLAKGPIPLEQTLTWAVQFCLGMEHARTRGIVSHRDVKPGNILIRPDGILKISDFGLATAAMTAWQHVAGRGGSLSVDYADAGEFGFSFVQAGAKARCGTPGYIAPEIYRGETADARSDIFSFGLVLWQMATGSAMPPYLPEYRGNMEMFLLQTYGAQIARQRAPVDGPLEPVIERCLRPNPAERWQSFRELRGMLEPLLEHLVGNKVEVPALDDNTAAFWCNRGASLAALNHRPEAISCYDRALAIDPKFTEAWHNKGIALSGLERDAEANQCFDRTLALDPQHKSALNLKALALHRLGWHQDAIACCDRLLALDPKFEEGWINKGLACEALGQLEAAVKCYTQVLTLRPKDNNIRNIVGRMLNTLGRHQEAWQHYERVLATDPGSRTAWIGKAVAYLALKEPKQALACCEWVLAEAPRDAEAHYNKGLALVALGKIREAVAEYQEAVASYPDFTDAWFNLGGLLSSPKQLPEAMACYEKVLRLDPRHAAAWFERGVLFEKMRRPHDAAANYRKFVELAPPNARSAIADAEQRIKTLTGID
ncbi:MAG TPA: tetratricopeptide repeat protein [Verrucomicrobiae bacterium]